MMPVDPTHPVLVMSVPVFDQGKRVIGAIVGLVSLRRIVEASFYVLRGGIPWRMMPHDFPPWEDVYYHLRKWRRKGTWERINQALRERHRVTRGVQAPADRSGDRQPVGQDHRGRRPARL